MRNIMLLLLSLICLSTCTPKKEKQQDNTSTILDSALNTYLHYKFDNLYLDTTDNDNKILLAYYKNDTSYLKAI